MFKLYMFDSVLNTSLMAKTINQKVIKLTEILKLKPIKYKLNQTYLKHK